MEIEKILILTLPFLIAGMVFMLIVLLALTYKPGKMIMAYERVNNQLREQKSNFFNYEKINDFLLANGAAFHFGKWVEPIKFFAIRLILTMLCFSVGIRFQWYIAVLAAVIGYLLPGHLLRYLNKKDNEKMLMQIQTVYNALIVQIKAGVYVTDAFAECYSRLEPGRLRTALEEVAGELFVKSSFDTAVMNLNRKFSNSFIDSLCIILMQGKETGKSAELLNDISEQIKDMNSDLLSRKKAALERTIDFCMLGILVAFMVLLIYVLAMESFSTASTL